jgi:transposase
VRATGSSLQDLNGIGPSGAARLIGDIGDFRRFASRGQFASWNGTAPLDASSGDQQRHCLSRAGNRRINRVLHINAIVQLRHDIPGRVYYRRRLADGKTAHGSNPRVERRLSDVVHRHMIRDIQQSGTGPENNRGRLCNPTRLTQTPRSTLRNSHFADPPTTTLEHRTPTRLTKRGAR